MPPREHGIKTLKMHKSGSVVRKIPKTQGGSVACIKEKPYYDVPSSAISIFIVFKAKYKLILTHIDISKYSTLLLISQYTLQPKFK